MNITVIHGTWSSPRHMSDLRDALVEACPGARVSCWRWSGRNSSLARLSAARDLASHLGTQQGPHVLVGHSHGGSVALYAALRAPALNDVRVVALNTPFIMPHLRRNAVPPVLFQWLLIAVSLYFVTPLVLQLAFPILALAAILDEAGVPLVSTLTVWILAAFIFSLTFWLPSWVTGLVEQSRSLSEDLALTGAETPRVLVVRRSGDEVSAGLGLLYSCEWFLSRLSTILLVAGTAAGLFSLLVLGTRSGDLYLVSIGVGGAVLSALLQGLGFGWNHIAHPWLYCTAESTPPGFSTTVTLHEPQDSPGGLFHTRVHKDSRVAPTIADWINSTKPGATVGRT